MAEVVKMPKMSDTMTEGVIAKWHKKVGDKVSSGDLIAEVETDKATMDFESYQEGTLLYIGPKEGEAVPIDAVIAVLGEEGEDYQALLNESNGNKTDTDSEKDETKAETEALESDDADVSTEDINAEVITMPLLSDTMTEGVIAEWHFKVGDTIKSDDVIADVETDKATMEVTAYADGTLLYIGVEKGQAAKVNDIIAIVGEEGTDVTPLLKQKSSKKAEAKTEEKDDKQASAEQPETTGSEKASAGEDDSRVKASPLARKIAKDKGISLTEVKGTGDGGRIIKKDVESYTPSAQPTAPAAAPQATASEGTTTTTISIPQYVGEERYTEKPVTQMRKTISRRLSESFLVPHFYLTIK
ncbi:MAG TPA: biotin/lipoyl-containing protein, partial [Parapedobacter sp.]|nr:biotin/lipoyl-containing protein [Parapedobacter sp.]